MPEPENLVLSLLREMRAEMKDRFDGVDRRFDQMDKRLDALREAMLGESVLGRYAAKEVETRLESIEKRLDALESSR